MNTSAICLWMLGCCVTVGVSRDFSVRVEAPQTDYRDAIVTASVPEDFSQTGALKDKDSELPFQRVADATIIFVLPELNRGAHRDFSVQPAVPAARASAELHDGQMIVSVDGKKAFVFQGRETDLPRANIKPIFKRG